MKSLYHFTSKAHLLDIIKSGKIIRTCSNLLCPTNLRIVDGKYIDDETDNHRPVVCLTDSLSPDKHGFEGARPLDVPFQAYKEGTKKRIRLEILMRPELNIRRWGPWADENNMDQEWRKAFIRGKDWHSWYITESEIPLSEVVEIYDMIERRRLPLPDVHPDYQALLA